jgi:hypothetical protein
VPANTGQRLHQVIEREQQALEQPATIRVASNPEFLREGQAVADTLSPDRIVYGTYDDEARDVLRELYAPLVERVGCPVVETDVPSAELIKHASNAFLATRISFINQVARICDRVGADVRTVARGMGLDERAVLQQVELPLASPVILAGIRIATVTTIGLVVVTAVIGQGGLGRLIFDGLVLYRTPWMWAGFVLCVAYAVVADVALALPGLGDVLGTAPWVEQTARELLGGPLNRLKGGI